MRPPTMLEQIQAATVEKERHRGEEQRHARHRALLEARAAAPSMRARLLAATRRVTRRDRHSLTDYPCRLPDGSIGRTAVVMRNGEWTLVCRLA
jgi:hypothetical protein